MAIRPILKYPDETLTALCDPVGAQRDGIRELVSDMAETMYAARGAGLAAPQVGERIRLFMVESEIAGLAATDSPMVFIDPEIIELSKEKQSGEEGCLSFPEIYVVIERAMHCRIRAYNLDGDVFEVEGSGLFARAIQHENDHLNGVLLTDHVGRLKRKSIARKMARYVANDAAE